MRTLLPLLFLAAACGSSPRHVEDAREQTPVASRDDRTSRTVATAGGDTDSGDGDCAVPTVYFDYDSADLATPSRDALDHAARCLARHPEREISLVGATDPRGTEEYNLALGDRRARTVKSYLSALGVRDARIRVTSVGEEEARGTSEDGWRTDRCVRPR